MNTVHSYFFCICLCISQLQLALPSSCIPMNNETAYTCTKDFLTILTQAFNEQECITYFGCNLIRKGHRPVQIKIQNQSGTTYTIGPDYLRYHKSIEPLPLTPLSTIISLVSYRLTLFLLLTIPVASLLYWQALPYGILPLGLITYTYNVRVKNVLQQITLSDDLVIKPFSSLTFLIFIPESVFYGLFDVSVFNTEEKTLTTMRIDAAGNSIHIPGVYVS